MKIIALHNKSGKILAAARLTENYKGPVPVAGKGTTVTSFDVPASHARLDLASVCRQLRVDAKTGKLTLPKTKSSRSAA